MLHIEEKKIHEIFIISLIIKGINSVIQIFAGTFFLFTGKVNALLSFIIKSELVEDPNDFIASQIQHLLVYFGTHNNLYISFYLLSHGIIKTVLVISLLRNKLWAYPGTIITILIFIAYQLYKLTLGYSLFLILLTIFDIFVIWLTWHEYKITRLHIEKRIANQECK